MNRRALVLSAAAALAAGSTAAFAFFSSHREAPLIADDPTADNTDVYAFVSPERPDRVVFLWNYIPLEEPAGGPNFHKFDDNVRYDFHVDNDGDALADVTYEFRFTTQVLDPNTFLAVKGTVSSLADPNYNVRQFYDVFELRPGQPDKKLNAAPVAVPPPNVGPTSTPNYEANLGQLSITTLPNGYRVFAGPRDEAFYVDLGAIFDRLTIRSPFGNMGGGKDGTAGYNVHACAIEIPIVDVLKIQENGSALTTILGVYSTASRRPTKVLDPAGGAPQLSGPWVQVSRLGSPLVNEVVIPLKDKDRFNASAPKDDAQFLSYVLTPEVPALLNALYGGAGLNTPTMNRQDLVAVFLTGVPGLTKPPGVVPCEVLRLNTRIPPKKPGDPGYSRLGVLGGDLSGFPNGRRVGDDVVDIELRALAGVLFQDAMGNTPFNVFPNNVLGDGVDANDVALPNTFPFLAAPQDGFTNTHGKQN